MTRQVRFRRGSTAQHAAFTGALGEVTVDTSKKTAVVHDGVTPGGWPLALENSSVANGLAATRAILKAMDPDSIPAAYLMESGREGRFVWRAGDFSTNVAADTLEGIYIKADSVAASVGAWVRAEKDPVNVKWFGAVGDGVTDDQAAFNAIPSVLPANGGEIYIPAGRYVLGAAWSIASKSVSIRGAGVKVAMLFFAGSTNGITYTANDLARMITVENLSIVTLTNASTIGLSISFPSNAGSSWKNCTIRDVVLDSTSTIAAYENTNNSQNAARWFKGIVANNVAGLTIDNVHVRGRAATKDSRGIEVTGWTVDMKITNCILQFHDVALFKKDALEGFNISGVVGLSCKEFVRIWNAETHVPANPSGTWGYITNCHSGCSVRVLDIRNYAQTFITNNLFYQDGASTTFSHIFASVCDGLKIIGNHLAGVNVANGWNIQLAGCYAAIVSNNFLFGRFFGVELDSSCTKPVVTGNQSQGSIANGATGTSVVTDNLTL
ncbi:glycosyl hydrolase family 28-related protein [Rhizobium sp. IY2]|uniref:hyaluronate lyase N-terminal domain-containing protein n=1 Tax=Rhizobium sp. IY2 TaxID=3397853 RepID=UPI0039E050FD